jgi:hypothetical protein
VGLLLLLERVTSAKMGIKWRVSSRADLKIVSMSSEGLVEHLDRHT